MAKISRARKALNDPKPGSDFRTENNAARNPGESQRTAEDAGVDMDSIEKAFEPSDDDSFPGTPHRGPASSESGADLDSVRAAFAPAKPSARQESSEDVKSEAGPAQDGQDSSETVKQVKPVRRSTAKPVDKSVDKATDA